jgi:hypothetical protein
MKEDKTKSVAADNTSLGEGIESLALPSEFDGAAYQAAVDFDQILSQGQVAEEAVQAKLMTYRDKLLDHLSGGLVPPPRPWPSSLYIPAGANWVYYWPSPPPDNNRYALDWALTPSPAGYNEASRVDGKILCSQRIRTVDQFAQSEAGLGVFLTPPQTLSVSLQPNVTCSGNHRWHQMIDQPVAGFTKVKTSLILAAWNRIPSATNWVLIHWKQFAVFDEAPQSGSGSGPIWSFDRTFSGEDLATPFTVEAGRINLLGVVARVNVWSTLTDAQGRPLPLIEDGTFRVWGSLGCVVSKIKVIEQ